MRVVKEAEVRKEEILDAAEKLFGVKGFDNTSTNDILEAVGIARGTLYYHFKSKEDILDGVIERMTGRLLADAKRIVRNQKLSLLERFTKAVMSLNVDSKIGYEVMEQVHRPQNALMHQKMQKQLLAGINPLFTELVEEGIEQGICHTDYPQEVVEMTMVYANTAFDDLDMADMSREEREKKISGFIYNVERLMGMEKNSLRAAILKIFQGSGYAADKGME